MPAERRIVRSTQLEKDFKLAQKRDGRSETDLRVALELLVEGEQLPERYRDHLLVGYRPPVRECHIRPDVPPGLPARRRTARAGAPRLPQPPF